MIPGALDCTDIEVATLATSEQDGHNNIWVNVYVVRKQALQKARKPRLKFVVTPDGVLRGQIDDILNLPETTIG